MLELTELYEEFQESRRRNAATAPEESAPHDTRVLVATDQQHGHGVPQARHGEVAME